MRRSPKKDARTPSNADQARALRLAGTAHFNGGRFARALECFQGARALGDRAPELSGFIAQALISSGEDAVRAALAADPRAAEARLALAESLRRRGQAALSAGRPAVAERLAREALAGRPAPDARRGLLDLLRACGDAQRYAGRLPEAARIFRGLLALDPRDAASCASLAAIARARGRTARERLLLARALRLDRGALKPADRFRALMKVGEYRRAIAQAEKILDAGATLSDARAFWDPWEWDDRAPRADRLSVLRRLERALRGATGPWLDYYRAELGGPDALAAFERLSAFPRRRYGWMYGKAGLAALCAGSFGKAVEWLELSVRSEPADWRARGFLAEALLCLKRPEDAVAQLDRACSEAPSDEAAQALAWRGALDLWLVRYDEALGRLEEARRAGAPCADCWRGAALLKLGRLDEALAALNETIARYPRDFEAYVWRGEALRLLGRPREALRDLDEGSGPRREPAAWLWALVNRALVKEDSGDEKGSRADFAALPPSFVEGLRARTGLTEPRALLLAALDRARGWRREEYGQAIWMS